MMLSASSLVRNCGYPRALSKLPPKDAAERKRAENKRTSADRGTVFHAAVEEWGRAGGTSVPIVADPEIQGWIDLLASRWRPPVTYEAELAWGLTPEGNYRDVLEAEPHVYVATDGNPLLTAGRADGIWTVEGNQYGPSGNMGHVAQGEPGIQKLGRDEAAVRQSSESGLAPLRREGDCRGAQVGGVREFPGGHGEEAAGGNPRASGQRGGVFEGKLSLGDLRGAEPQSQVQQARDLHGDRDASDRGSREVGTVISNAAVAAREGMGRTGIVLASHARQRTLYVIDFKTGKWPVEHPRTNLQVNAAGLALSVKEFARYYVPGVYYTRDGVFDWGEPVELGSAAWRQRLAEVQEAANLGETPRPGPHCGSCWERKRCAHAA